MTPSEANDEAIRRIIAKIPRGACCGYGAVGRALPFPISGLLVGRWLRRHGSEVPWWRVVGAGGDLLTARLDPQLGHEQRERLLSENVEFDSEGRVERRYFAEVPSL